MTPDLPDTAPPQGAPAAAGGADGETCDICGSADVRWVKCKLVCGNCRSIVKSCADL
ncbi:MAG TPA: hypothetical protein VFS05_16170 [Gemmatimonadaceae bacterium]|nr:hypothetical protein [Gemmatimonadaceae bacterium]